MVILCIHTRQVSDLLFVSERQAQRILKTIRSEVNKKKKQAVTLKEFCKHLGFDEADVLTKLSQINERSKEPGEKTE
jgi:hypothetical protein